MLKVMRTKHKTNVLEFFVANYNDTRGRIVIHLRLQQTWWLIRGLTYKFAQCEIVILHFIPYFRVILSLLSSLLSCGISKLKLWLRINNIGYISRYTTKWSHKRRFYIQIEIHKIYVQSTVACKIKEERISNCLRRTNPML